MRDESIAAMSLRPRWVDGLVELALVDGRPHQGCMAPSFTAALLKR
jgi:hypothetical protein